MLSCLSLSLSASGRLRLGAAKLNYYEDPGGAKLWNLDASDLGLTCSHVDREAFPGCVSFRTAISRAMHDSTFSICRPPSATFQR